MKLKFRRLQKITEDKIKLVDTFLFNNYDDKYYVHKKNIHTDKVALLLDPRCHYRLRPIIVNHMKHLKDWNLYVIGTKESVNYIKLILPNVDFDFCIINEKNINTRQVTDILLNEKLYIDYLKAYEHILTFQVDSIMFKPFNYEIFKHDYIGAYDAMMKTENSVSHVYNGGISYRKKSFMLKCIKNYNHEILSQKRKELGYIVNDYYPEDFYLSMCLSLMKNGKLQDVEYNDECKIFLQNDINSNEKILNDAMTIHGFDKHTNRFISFKDMKYLIDINTFNTHISQSA